LLSPRASIDVPAAKHYDTRPAHPHVRDAVRLEDLTAKLGPAEWARLAVSAYRRHRADRIVAEVNNGGQLVEATLRNVDSNIPYKEVHASRGKAIRAEPVSALYEQHKVHHVGTFAELEDQMCSFTSDFDRGRAGYSPDRVDALVWAITEIGDRQPFVVTPEMLQRFSRPRSGTDGYFRRHGY